jgi:DNA polymerase III subunit epsilon
MEFILKRDLIFLDVETTGLQVLRDRIIQIALIKYPKKGGPPIELEMLINPGIPISEESMAIHGITPKDLAKKPSFSEVAQEIWDFIGDGDLAGYNSTRFDIPMLMEEFGRVGFEFSLDNRRFIDVQRIFYKMEPRTLKAAYQFYCQAELKDAHDAMADVKATVEVLRGQLKMYEGKDLLDEENNSIPNPVINDIQALHDFTNDFKQVDVTQKLKRNSDGSISFNFGKYTGQKVIDVLKKDKYYYDWIMEKEFSQEVKQIVKKLMYENQ